MEFIISISLEKSITRLPDYFVQAGWPENNRIFGHFVDLLPLQGAENVQEQGI
jgi:hypothetical protein